MRKELFSVEVLQSLDKLTLDEARAVAQGLVKLMPRKSINQATAVDRISKDIERAPSATEVSRIMYQVYLSGTGLGTVGSAWKKHYGNV